MSVAARRTWILLAVMLCGVAGLPCISSAQRRQIDTRRSVIKVQVYKSGLFSAFAHDHEILAPIEQGSLDDSAHSAVDVRVQAGKLQVIDRGVSDKDRAEIQEKMLGPDVLDAARYPVIHFESTGIEKAAPDRWIARGTLALHGQSRQVAVDVSREGKGYRGSVTLKQTDFGIKPVRIAGGTVKIKDAVRIDFEIFVETAGEPGPTEHRF